MIYIISCDDIKTCKIGFSKTPELRLQQLQTANPYKLEIVYVENGDSQKEKYYHSLFKDFKMEGEWFEYNDEIKNYFNISSLFNYQTISRENYLLWDYIEEIFTPKEYLIVHKLYRLSEAPYNYVPLTNDMTYEDVSSILNTDRRKIKSLLDRFMDLGIYTTQEYTKFWILNPYLSFGGKLIHSDIAKLFEGTKLTNEYNKRCKEKQKNS
jgi:hypothetical protein